MSDTLRGTAFHSIRHAALATALLAFTGMPARAGDWKGTLDVGAGAWGGEASYSIGGVLWDPSYGYNDMPDKISELTFPLDVSIASVGGSMTWKNDFEFRGLAMFSLTDPDTSITDSDWDWEQLVIYSETDAELSAWTGDAGLTCWFMRSRADALFGWTLGAGMNLLVQHFEWTASNLDQWYPSNPEFGHDYHRSGDVMTYEADVLLPYASLSALLSVDRLSGRFDIGVGPAYVQDKDDHLLREIRSETDMTGVGLKGSAEFRWAFTAHLFAQMRATALSIETDGTEKDTVYGGVDAGDRWEIGHEFSLSMATIDLSAGYAF